MCAFLLFKWSTVIAFVILPKTLCLQNLVLKLYAKIYLAN